MQLESIFGQGSTFEIQLPLLFDTSTNTTEEAKKTVPKNHNIRPQTFVVIDDDINLLNLTSGVLRQEKHQVLSFNSAIKALESIEKTNFDFIITDIQMPEMDGFMFLKKLKNTSFYKNQPVIALTGRSDLETSVYSDSGFTTVVKKPYSPKILLDTIRIISENDSLPKDIINETAEKSNSQLYSLDTLKEFLANDKNALNDVLKSFIESTDENLAYLENAIKDENKAEINAIAHRIAPMFKQIEANEIAGILLNLEKNEFEITAIKNIQTDLKAKIKSLFEALKQEIV
ncbi:response regulator [Flavobacterium sp. P21]|uniref:response regulator n=1 Tax=Flavobacterium sp. P21 TaxID=3423948 RepID=UPI003D664B0D